MHERCTDWGPRRKQREHEIDIEKTRVKRIKRSQQGYGIVWCFGTVATGGAIAILYLQDYGPEVVPEPRQCGFREGHLIGAVVFGRGRADNPW